MPKENNEKEMPQRYMGKEVRAPRKAGRPKVYTEVGTAKAHKPLKEMTPQERREYDAARKRKSLAKKAENTTAPLTSKTGRFARTRVYAPTQEEAERVAGEDAVAMKLVKMGLPVELWERARKTAWALRGEPTNLDTTALVALGLEAVIEQLEAKYNGGYPFTEEPPSTDPTKGRSLTSRKNKTATNPED